MGDRRQSDGRAHGIRSFLPHIRAHGEGGHIVNTASMAGMQSGLGFSPYGASKFAVVGMSEGLAMQLKPFGIGVSVLCPSFVRTRIGESGRNRPRALRRVADARSRKPGGGMVAEIAEQIAGRARSRCGRRARARRDPGRRTLRFHPSRHAGRGRGAVSPPFWPRWTCGCQRPIILATRQRPYALFLPAKRR